MNGNPNSSTMAEAWALRDGLELAIEENIKCLDAEVDALVITQLITQRHLECHLLSNVIYDWRSLVEKFEAIAIKHIHCEANHCADALTKDPPISVGDFYIYLVIPSCIPNFIHEDLMYFFREDFYICLVIPSCISNSLGLV
ncbi:hypothetical protein Vadar_010839 [Vaccinium darrowii]|uniref:Uncharacterized protein n=1 Tax=Vaccinium darrowii TaxID=229202 RepID=A0ACB7X947_9ERIC|nr:hypothetical protein Vadar_010839 [Vaccinium darrowii]